MSPDVKEALDYLVTFLGTGSLGGALLALLGIWKAGKEKPHVAAVPEAAPPVGQIGGLVLTERQIMEFIRALDKLADAYDRSTDMSERALEQQREQSQLQRNHERDLAAERHSDSKRLIDAVDTLGNRVRNIACAN